MPEGAVADAALDASSDADARADAEIGVRRPEPEPEVPDLGGADMTDAERALVKRWFDAGAPTGP